MLPFKEVRVSFDQSDRATFILVKDRTFSNGVQKPTGGRSLRTRGLDLKTIENTILYAFGVLWFHWEGIFR